MAEYKKFRRNFVERTRELLVQCSPDDEREVTKLINYAYGLIVYPKSQIHYSKWPKYQFNDSDTTYGFTKQSIKYLHDEKPKYGLYQILRHVRNGWSHSLIKGENDKGNVIGIQIEDKNNDNSPVNFRLEITIAELKTFALKISEDYLKILPEEE